MKQTVHTDPSIEFALYVRQHAWNRYKQYGYDTPEFLAFRKTQKEVNKMILHYKGGVK